MTPAHGPLRTVLGPDLTTRQLHDLLALRVQVFVVEQGDPYQAIDGVDLEPTSRHLWIERGGEIASAIRLAEWTDNRDGHRGDQAWRIGAVITAESARGQGLAGRLIRSALELTQREAPRRDVVLHAQAHLADWYGRFGFVVEGDEHLDGHIPHLWMRLTRSR
ncbi:GNAT family N-acetyltransferase [Aestuariimicrobium soli]|uniref:GNAT family N-acetyltransferase n=1 Tax=Aestuariimicrobium soli TaxID=2035834 RepID=UPI003EB8F271